MGMLHASYGTFSERPTAPPFARAGVEWSVSYFRRIVRARVDGLAYRRIPRFAYPRLGPPGPHWALPYPRYRGSAAGVVWFEAQYPERAQRGSPPTA